MKKVVSILLAVLIVCMTVSATLVSAFAEEGDSGFLITTTIVNGNISPTKNIIEGGSYTVEYAPRTVTGYVLDSVKVDGNPVSLVDYATSYTFTNIKAPHTIEVVYLHTYPVVFDTNGGSRIIPQTVKQGDKVTKPQDPEKTGFSFAGWYENEELSVPYDFDTPITEPTTIYADYTVIEYTLHYDANGGVSGSAPEDQSMYINDEARVSKIEPVWLGHTFRGWSTDSDAKNPQFLPGDTFKSPGIDKAPDTTLYAVWYFDIAQFDYKAGEGGSVDVQSETILADADPSETTGGSLAKPEVGYRFTVWKNSKGERVSTNPFFSPERAKNGIFVSETYSAFFVIDEEIYGDVDRDGEVSILDVTIIQRYLAFFDDNLTYVAKICCDADGDGTISILDCTHTQRYISKLSCSDNVGKHFTI